MVGRHRIASLLEAFSRGGRQSVAAAIVGYLAVYVLLALFPFDFAISLGELSEKFNSARFGWLLAGDNALSFRRLASLAGELVAIIPLGLLVGLLATRISLGRTFLGGVLLGLMLEFFQLFVLSSVTQGASILVRGIGLAGGAFVLTATDPAINLGCCGGVQTTASHNPAQYNGIKFCLAGARPVGADSGLTEIKEAARAGVAPVDTPGEQCSDDLLRAFTDHVRSFADTSVFTPLKVVADESTDRRRHDAGASVLVGGCANEA